MAKFILLFIPSTDAEETTEWEVFEHSSKLNLIAEIE
jgi:hypothetical protein